MRKILHSSLGLALLGATYGLAGEMPQPKKFVLNIGGSKVIEIDYDSEGRRSQKVTTFDKGETTETYTYYKGQLKKKDTVARQNDGDYSSKQEEYFFSDQDKPILRTELSKSKDSPELVTKDQFVYDANGALKETLRATTIQGTQVDSHSVFNSVDQKLKTETSVNGEVIFYDNFTFYPELPLDYQADRPELLFFSPMANRAFAPWGRPYREYDGHSMALGRPNVCVSSLGEFRCTYILTGEGEGEDKGQELMVYKELGQQGLQLYKIESETEDRHNSVRSYSKSTELFEDADLRKWLGEDISGFFFQKRSIDKTIENDQLVEYSEYSSDILRNADGSLSKIKLYSRSSPEGDFELLGESDFLY